MNDNIRKEHDNFTHNVAWLRKHHGLTKKEMAQMLGIGVSSLTKLENGIVPQRMTTEVLNQLCTHFHVDLSDLFAIRLDE